MGRLKKDNNEHLNQFIRVGLTQEQLDLIKQANTEDVPISRLFNRVMVSWAEKKIKQNEESGNKSYYN